MEKKHRVCKICYKKFANGKAMGGHMRSHFAKLRIPPKLSVHPSPSLTPSLSNDNNLSSPSPSALLSYEINYMQPPPRSVYEEEAESLRNPTRRRSKRLRKKLSMVRWSSNSVSSVALADEILSNKDAAMCLLMLSRDKRVSTYSPQQEQELDGGVEHMNIGVDGDDGNDGNDGNDGDDDDDLFCVSNSRARAHQKYKCEACNKVFKSHQALGGHRASHKNKQIVRVSAEEEGEGGEERSGGGDHEEIHQQRNFECPFCDKVFQSGQALGGHKKIHFTYLAVADKVTETSTSAVQLFDLNLPAPEYES